MINSRITVETKEAPFSEYKLLENRGNADWKFA